MSSGGRPVRSLPPTVTVPADILITPTRLLSRVLFPDPLAPTSDTTWPGSTWTLMSRITGSPPYPAVTPSARNATPGPPGHRDHRIAELVHDRELVLHHEHGKPAGRQRGELVADPPGQVRVHAGHRLVREENPLGGPARGPDLLAPPPGGP